MATAYDEVILDHIRNARNYRVPRSVSREIRGSNPLCGDELVLYLDLDGDTIADIAYQCTCCGLSMASASVMSERVKGRPAAEVRSLLRQLTAKLGARLPSDPATLDSGQRALLDAATRFPGRIPCIALPWNTLATALPETSNTA